MKNIYNWIKQHLPFIFTAVIILIVILLILGKNTTMVMIPIAIILGIIQASMIINADAADYYVKFIAFLVPLSFEVILFVPLYKDGFIKLNVVSIIAFLSGFILTFIIHMVYKHYMNYKHVRNASDDNDGSYFTV